MSTQNANSGGLVNGSGTRVCIGQLDYSASAVSWNSTTVTYYFSVYIYCVNYGYSTTSVLSTSLSCTGQTTRTTSGGDCDINAGQRARLSPAPNSSPGYWAYSFPLTTSQYTRTINFSVTSTGSSVHGTSSGALTITIPALSHHTVSYNANDGTGSINSQNKYYGNNITLSDGMGFTRTNHTLTGWNTKADGTGTPYALGATYSDNSTTNVTLYAQWHMDYIKPTITNAQAYRVRTTTSSTPYDNGTCIYVSFSYTGGKFPTSDSYTPPKYIISINGTSRASGTMLQASGSWPTTVTAYESYSTNTSHTITIKLYDGTDAEGTTVTLTVGIPTFPIDLITDGNNTYMGVMTAAQNGTLLSVPSVRVINAISQNSIKIGNSFVVDFVVEEGEQAVTSNGNPPYNFGDGYWRWREWKSGKVEIWYYGSVTLVNPSTTSGVYRYMRRIDFPNSYSLDKCVGIVNGTLGGGWLNCGGVFDANDVHKEPFTRIEVMAYRIGSSPSQIQDNTHIYICGEKHV